LASSGAIVREIGAVLVGVFLATLALTAWARRIALRQGILDVPNERSSHFEPTPRGGGVAIVISASCAIALFALMHRIDPPLATALIAGGLLMAAMGYIDDRRPLPPGIRILAHVAVAGWAVYLLGGLPPLRIGAHLVSLGIWGDIAGVVAIVWVLNLFNFMDGIDGIAASEAAFVTGAGGMLAIVFDHDVAVGYGAVVIAVAALAFLWWNWPPAKIFMGDVGSCYLGYTIAVLGFAAGRGSPVASLAWLILGAAFFVDATTTLLIRLKRRQRIYTPHREHVYQLLAARWHSHRSVTLLVGAVNLIVLLPTAVLAVVHPELAAWAAALSLLCMSAAVLLVRAAEFLRKT
jgi:Fuc2NAc and GlcNAc transferase